MMRALNLYAGIGGNRKLWPDYIKVTAVELVPEIAQIYKDLYPTDNVIVADAHQYLLENYHKFDFIWSSPPCVSHSDIRRMAAMGGQYNPVYPDMNLYQEIIFLSTFYKGNWVVENTKPYYKPLIRAYEVGRHLFWSNFPISKKKLSDSCIIRDISSNSEIYGFNLKKYSLSSRKDQILRNCVNPKLGLHVFNCAFKEVQNTLQNTKKVNKGETNDKK